MTLQTDIRDRYIFEYTTLSRIRSEGLLAATVADADVRTLIREMSKLINNVTGQWFWPIESKERINGKGYPRISHPSSIPILEVRTVQKETSTATTALTSSEFVVHKRDIELTGYSAGNVAGYYVNRRRTKFSKRRPLNVIVDGTWGWLENRPFVTNPFDEVAKVETTFSATLTDADTTVTVASTTGFRVGDVIVVRSGDAGNTYAGHAIVTEVTDATTLTFDAINLNVASVASGNVVTYGQVPEAVNRACAILVIKYKDSLNSASAQAIENTSQLISERTDNYQYNYSSANNDTSGDSTGDDQADKLLSNYKSPLHVSFI